MNKYDIKNISNACRVASDTLEYIAQYVKKGVSTGFLNDICHEYILKNKAIPASLNYFGYPKSVCISVNSTVCHGIPNNNVFLKYGDIVNIDVAVIKNGYYGDTSKMFFVCNKSDLKNKNMFLQKKKLLQVSLQCLYKAIFIVKPGIYINKIGYTIQKHANNNGFSVVKEYCGHGIGKKFHDKPYILHYYKKNDLTVLKKDMCFTIEPMINMGSNNVKVLSDGWTVVTKDNNLSSQWEHTIIVTEKSCKVLTIRKEEKYILRNFV